MRGRVRLTIGTLVVREAPATPTDGVGLAIAGERLYRDEVEALRDELSRWLEENGRR